MSIVRAVKTGVCKYGWPRKPLLPVGAGAEVDPLVIPLFGIRMTPVMVDLARRKQQHIAGTTDELLIVVFDYPFPTHGQVQNVPFHPKRTVNVKIEISLSLDRGQPRHQVGVKRITRQ